MSVPYKKYPRLYVESPLNEGGFVSLSKEQSHYLVNVMRKAVGDGVRLFNGKDGEYVCEITEASKKSVGLAIQTCIVTRPVVLREVHLYFAPIKKQRMEWMIEKSVELGVTHLHPVLTQNPEVRKLNDERVRHQIIEACEQCERLDVPELCEVMDLKKSVATLPQGLSLFAAIERQGDVPLISDVVSGDKDMAVLIGPEGGFTQEEVDWLKHQGNVSAVSLGVRILRAETAALYVLSIAE